MRLLHYRFATKSELFKMKNFTHNSSKYCKQKEFIYCTNMKNPHCYGIKYKDGSKYEIGFGSYNPYITHYFG